MVPIHVQVWEQLSERNQLVNPTGNQAIFEKRANGILFIAILLGLCFLRI